MGDIFFYKYLLTKHKKPNISATVHLTRKKFIYSGRYLKGAHFEKNWMGGGPFKNAEGGALKLIMSKLPTNSKLSQSIISAMGMNN